MVNAFRWMVFVIGLAVVIGSIMIASAEDPVISIGKPSDGETVKTRTITVSGTAEAMEGYIDSVTVNNISAGIDTWSADIQLEDGPNPITVVATTDMNQSSSKTITVYYQALITPPTQPPRDYEAPSAIPTPTPSTGSISITSTPPGAEVYLDDSPTKKNTNITLENVTVRSHKIEVTKKGFRSKTKYKYVRAGGTEELDFVLEPLTVSIFVFSTPSEASVYLDDDDMNKTTDCTLSEVVVGPHTITLKKSGYFDETRNVSVSVRRTTCLYVNLTPCPRCGYINISSNPPKAKVYLDGKYKGETPKNISTVALGNHTIKLTLSDYFDVIRNVSVSVGETCPLRVNLTGYGSLCISSNPSKAKVYLDDVYKGETALNISKVVEGTHTIKLTKWSYEDVEKMIHLSAGELIEEHVTLSIPAYVELSIQGGAFAVILAIIGILSNYVVIPVISSKLEKKRLFKLDPRYKQCLKDGDVDTKLKKVFKKEKQSLTSEAKVSKIPEQWRIVDGKKQYRVEDSGEQLDIYKKRSR